MSAFLLYHPKTRPTGRQLCGVLGIPGGIRVRGTPSTVLRWGSQRFPEAGGVNTPSSLALASDKLRAFIAFHDAGVRIPEFTTTPPLGFDSVWLGRSRRGYGGKDIVVYEQPPAPYPAVGHEFYTRYIPNTREYRIHVFNGEVIRVQGKYLDFPDDHTIPHIKNYVQGFRFRTPDKTLNSSRANTAINAVAVLGLLFGAVDLLIGEDGLEYVLEVNTAPKLASLTCSQYADAIRTYLEVHNGSA